MSLSAVILSDRVRDEQEREFRAALEIATSEGISFPRKGEHPVVLAFCAIVFTSMILLAVLQQLGGKPVEGLLFIISMFSALLVAVAFEWRARRDALILSDDGLHITRDGRRVTKIAWSNLERIDRVLPQTWRVESGNGERIFITERYGVSRFLPDLVARVVGLRATVDRAQGSLSGMIDLALREGGITFRFQRPFNFAVLAIVAFLMAGAVAAAYHGAVQAAAGSDAWWALAVSIVPATAAFCIAYVVLPVWRTRGQCVTIDKVGLVHRARDGKTLVALTWDDTAHADAIKHWKASDGPYACDRSGRRAFNGQLLEQAEVAQLIFQYALVKELRKRRQFEEMRAREALRLR